MPSSGDRGIVMVDDQLEFTELAWSSRVNAFIEFGPGVVVRVGSRCVNKRRVTVLHITCARGEQ